MLDTQTMQTLQDLPQAPDISSAETESAPQQTQPSGSPSPKELNFRRLEADRARVEQERDAAYRRLQELEAKTVQPQADPDDDDFQIAPDALAEGKDLAKVVRQVKKLKQELSQYKQHSTESVTEARLKSQYPDFDQIVNTQNINALREQYPDIAATLNSSTDLYSKASSAYQLIKKFGIAEEDSYMKDKEKVQKNSDKPRPAAAISGQSNESPLTRTNAFENGLTKDLKSQLYKEMIESMKYR